MRIHALAAVVLFSAAASAALPRGVLPMRSQADRVFSAASAAPPANAHLNYYGGHVISNVHVIPVMWGNNVPSAVSGGIAAFYSAVTDSNYFDWLSEYDTNILDYAGNQGTNQHIGRGTSDAARVITPSVTGTALTDQQITTELQAQINAGHLPASDADTIYMIHFPAGTKISMPDGSGGTASSCTQFCAYHNTIAHSPSNIFYGIIPNVTTDGCELGCGPAGGGFNNTTSVASHELIEAVTDAEVGLATDSAPPLAWYDPQGQNGEIGDICNGAQGTITSHNQTWTVQTEWSNAQGACIGTPASTDFYITVSPGDRAIAAGSSGTYTVTSAATSGSPGTITLSASGLPAGLTASFSPASISPGQSSTMTLSVTTAATNGADVFDITGSAGGVSRHGKSQATVSGGTGSGGTGGGGGGGGGCPAGTIDLGGGICLPVGCNSTGVGSAWFAALGLGALFMLRKRRS